jgi:hypothetical protein
MVGLVGETPFLLATCILLSCTMFSHLLFIVPVFVNV